MKVLRHLQRPEKDFLALASQWYPQGRRFLKIRILKRSTLPAMI